MTDEFYIRRCFQLAKLALQKVKTNPQVGAVLVYNNRIIGEGYHQFYGGPHAEVNAIKNVKNEDLHLIRNATLYVSLEPCCIDGKTPACSDLILKQGIKKVVVSCTDPNPKVSGYSLEHLKKKGINIISGVLENEGLRLIDPFILHLKGLPYVSLKWAKSKDHFIGHKDESIWLSNHLSKIYAHKLRSINDGILIGTTTAVQDNPQLNTREYPGTSPTRIVIDRSLKTPKTYHLRDGKIPTIFITDQKCNDSENLKFISIDFGAEDFIDQLLKVLFKEGIYRLLIEGGAATLRHFIKTGHWNEAHIIQTDKILTEGIKSPLIHGDLVEKLVLDQDQIFKIVNKDAQALKLF